MIFILKRKIQQKPRAEMSRLLDRENRWQRGGAPWGPGGGSKPGSATADCEGRGRRRSYLPCQALSGHWSALFATERTRGCSLGEQRSCRSKTHEQRDGSTSGAGTQKGRFTLPSARESALVLMPPPSVWLARATRLGGTTELRPRNSPSHELAPRAPRNFWLEGVVVPRKGRLGANALSDTETGTPCSLQKC